MEHPNIALPQILALFFFNPSYFFYVCLSLPYIFFLSFIKALLMLQSTELSLDLKSKANKKAQELPTPFHLRFTFHDNFHNGCSHHCNVALAYVFSIRNELQDLL
jgi:hypothetical protein